MSEPTDLLEAVYRTLCDECGAPSDFDSFTSFACEWFRGVREYRFQGALGFGGKFWDSGGRWYVTCYREDETPEIRAMIESANVRLSLLRKELDEDSP